jgi:probable phosphoglycerate mutase
MTELVLIRHGETDWNVEGRYQGQADPPLNYRGIQQAGKLAEELKDSGIEILISSPLKRTAQTAEILANKLQVPVYQDPRFMEIHQGDWQTRLRSEIEEKYPDLFRRWESEPWQVTPPGGEHLRQVQSRVCEAVDEIMVNYSQNRVGLVLHRIPIALIKMRFQRLDADIVRTIHLPNTYWEIINLNDNRK